MLLFEYLLSKSLKQTLIWNYIKKIKKKTKTKYPKYQEYILTSKKKIKTQIEIPKYIRNT